VEYAAAGNQTVDNALTYRTLRISGVKSLPANLPALNAVATTEGNFCVDAATLDLSTFTASRAATTVGGSFSVGGGATLRIGGINAFPAHYATHALAPASARPAPTTSSR
jgi:hypothetical protein